MSTLEGLLFGESTYGSAYYGSPLGGTITVPSFSTSPLTAKTIDYETVQLSWNLPTSGYLLQLIRNSFSDPTDQNDGVVLEQFEVANGVWPTPFFVDNGASPAVGGQWVYYALFMLTSVGGYWIRSSSAQVMIPGNWGSAARMFSLVPQYYQNMDDTMFDPFFIQVSTTNWNTFEGLTWNRLIGEE